MKKQYAPEGAEDKGKRRDCLSFSRVEGESLLTLCTEEKCSHSLYIVYYPICTCTSNQETSTEAQGFPLRDVFPVRARTPPVEIYNINKSKVTLSVIAHGPKSDKQLSHPALVLNQTHNDDFFTSTLQAICCQTMLSKLTCLR